VRWPPAWESGRWSIDLVLGQSTVGKTVYTEGYGIVGNRHQATIDEDIANREGFMYVVATMTFGVHNSVRLL
jgi:hypothetical protein